MLNNVIVLVSCVGLFAISNDLNPVKIIRLDKYCSKSNAITERFDDDYNALLII